MMVDMLPFPKVVGDTPEMQIGELLNYLIQFKETLEFALTNISTENLSPDLINKLNELGANIEENKARREEETPQLMQLVKTEINNINVVFKVKFDTGHLEYTVSE